MSEEEEIEEEELYECPNCGELKTEDELELLHETFNTDEVCDDCILECGYYE